MQTIPTTHYTNKISQLETELKSIKKRLSRLYLMRLVTFLAFVAMLVLFVRSSDNYLFPTLALVCFALFLLAVKLDLKYAFLEKYRSNLLTINQNEIKFLDHQYSERETGDTYRELNPHLSADFDLFGQGSLFQYLNRCSSLGGKLKLAEGLVQSRQEKESIEARQNAIRELTSRQDFVETFRAHGMFLSENGSEVGNLEAWLQTTEVQGRLLSLLCVAIPLINLGWLALAIGGVFTLNSLWIPAIASLSIVGYHLKDINRSHDLLSKSAGTFKSYTTIFRLMEETTFQSDYLISLQEKLSDREVKAGESLTALYKLLNSFDQRLNVLVSVLLNALFIYDIQIWLRLGKWKQRNKTKVSGWFEALSELDALISFSLYGFNNSHCVSYPEVAGEDFTFQATVMGHPLIHPETRICNDLLFTGSPRILIITGANMAGKSTFLRTLTVNLILAMNGAPVCAKSFRFTPCDLLSSIKIQDSLSNNESYFYAELVRIREIIDHVQRHPHTLVILDEILRGTNTRDKQTGSRGLLEKLISLNAVVLIATHDLALGELESDYPYIVTNNCFEVELTNDQLIFDYKLKPGISQKLNASYLMRKMGIIEES